MNSTESSLRPRLSLCMIVKNEANNLPRCLSSAKPYVDEIIVVDTGSADNTIQIAEQYGAEISHFSWCNDFAAARNYSISKATGDWILVLDADEELVVSSKTTFNRLGTEPEVFLYALVRVEAADDCDLSELFVDRLFRNLPGMVYVGGFHENIRPPQEYIGKSWIEHLPELQIRHYGYDAAGLLDKARRNILILEEMRQQQGLDLRLLFTLATMYEKVGEQGQSLICQQEAFEQIFPDLISGDFSETIRTGSVAGLLYTCGLYFLEHQDYETLQLICQRGLAWFPSYPPLSYLAGLTLSDLGFALGATAYFQYCLHLGRSGSYFKGEPFNAGFVTSYAAYSLGCAYTELQNCSAAKDAMLLTLSFDPSHAGAQEALEDLERRLSHQFSAKDELT
jgi:tetratricopeptide (TPR) repeat protein